MMFNFKFQAIAMVSTWFSYRILSRVEVHIKLSLSDKDVSSEEMEILSALGVALVLS